MKKSLNKKTSLALAALLLLLAGHQASATTAAETYRGRIVLATSGSAHTWWINPKTLSRVALADATDVTELIRNYAVGVSNATLAAIPTSDSTNSGNATIRTTMSGRILLAVEQHGQIWYVHPVNKKRYQLGTAAEALEQLRALGVTLSDSARLSIPTEQNLAVPFTVQAPFGVWDEDHNEFCEETSVLMVSRYLLNQRLGNRTNVDNWLERIKAWELDNFGFHLDTNAAQSAQMLRDIFSIDSDLVVNPTREFMKKTLDGGTPIIIPVAGRYLKNPHFRAPGPDYHMIVIKGYRGSNFIANDPGTSHGGDYLYSQSTIMQAIHDYNNGDPEHGQKVIIVPKK